MVKAIPWAAPLPLAAKSGDADADLLSAAQRDPTEFIALYDRYARRVHGYVRVRIRDTARAEDVTSHVFMTALSKIGSVEAGSNFSAWLFRIAQNAVVDAYREQRAEQVADETFAALPDAAPGPEEQVVAAEGAERLRGLVATLRPEQQHLLALRYGAGLSFAEIGMAGGKTAVAARVAVHRAIAELRRRYPYEE